MGLGTKADGDRVEEIADVVKSIMNAIRINDWAVISSGPSPFHFLFLIF